jgi:Domain of unknown function (DUF4397)
MRIRTLALALALAVVPASAAFAQEAGIITVVHGIPGEDDFPVDVYVNGDLTLEGFTFGSVTDPLELPAADYDIEIFPGGADPEADEPALSDTVTLPAGANASIVAHLTESGDPELTVFVNDTSPIDAGNGRVVLRHTAAAPAVDVLSGDTPLAEGLTNRSEAQVDVPAGDYPVSIVPAGGGDPVFSVDAVPVAEGEALIAYAIGTVEGPFTVAVQTISGLHGSPSGVPTGDGGAAGGFPLWLGLLMAVAAVGVAGSVALARRR